MYNDYKLKTFKERTTSMQTYTAIYQRDPETGWYAASVEELPAAISQGQTLEEARENLRDAISLVLEVMHEDAERATAGQQVIREPISV